MPFKQAFERRVNDDMQTSEAGPAPRSPTASRPSSIDTSDMKKQSLSPEAKSIYEAEDLDLSSKGEKTLPPRFSTLFDTSKAAPLAPPTPRMVECCHRESKKKSGVYLSTPVFVLLVVVLLFESTLLFAYTVIGLYQNLPSGLLAVTGAPTPVDGCHCEASDRQGTINFAPNFVFGAGGASNMDRLSVIETTTAVSPSSTTEASATTASTTSSSTSSSTRSTSTAPTNSAEAAAASQILDLFGGGKETVTTTPKVSVTTSTPGLVRSTVIVTSSLETSAAEPPRSTLTSVQVVDGPTTTIQARSVASA